MNHSPSQAGYEVILHKSGKTLPVPPGMPLLDVLIGADVPIIYDCRAGYCGLCQVKVLDGEVAHHDICLTQADRLQGLMQVCVSHAAGAHLTLDL
jgi:vanillate O-demethylase ferredoxin subunit